jgi:hypothetical protein
MRADDPTQIAECQSMAWGVAATCGTCRHEVFWGVADLVARFPLTTTLDDIAARAKCSACGSTEGRVYRRQDHSAKSDRARAWEKVLEERARK